MSDDTSTSLTTSQPQGRRRRQREVTLFDNPRNAILSVLLWFIVAALIFALIYSLVISEPNIVIALIALVGLVVITFIIIRYALSSDRLRAVQTKRSLDLASKTLEYMRGGLSPENCQEVCNILLPESQAMAVAMTDETLVLGYAGEYAELFPVGSPIHTSVTHEVLLTQQLEVFTGSGALEMRAPSAEELISMREKAQENPDVQEAQESTNLLNKFEAHPEEPRIISTIIPAGIVAPLIVRGQAVGTLKLYYDAPHRIDETQCAIAEGLAELLSTQLYIAELDRQVELATKAELQALQSQVNPHFLFNTINTIASLIRTDPARARGLLREFAIFYRQTLENSDDLIPLEREVQQTVRYLAFVKARFGDDRISSVVNVPEDLEEIRVPSFIIQPIVENSVNHAMRPEGMLNITVDVSCLGDDVEIRVSDDGTGMTPETAANLLEEAAPSRSGTGIALRNVDGRLRTVFGPRAGITVESEVGVGTTVTLHLVGALSAANAQN